MRGNKRGRLRGLRGDRIGESGLPASVLSIRCRRVDTATTEPLMSTISNNRRLYRHMYSAITTIL